jgi:2-hydroxy-3-keto-5-methylthiopentenyl-1-phosphate phosphatase
VHFRLGLRIENNLRQTFPVTQVDKYQIAVVSIGMDPSCQRNFFAGIIQPELATIMCSFEQYKISLNKKDIPDSRARGNTSQTA